MLFFPFTLSGLLNIIDGLWSSCGDERIIVFTTNHKDRLDPALLCPGRKDLHVHMSYCTVCTMDGFKLLTPIYLDINGDHQLYRQIEGLLTNVLEYVCFKLLNYACVPHWLEMNSHVDL